MRSTLKKLKESIGAKWLVLYYTFFFLFGSYVLIQVIMTAVTMMLTNDAGRSIEIQGLFVTIDGVKHEIWNLPEFYIAIIVSTLCIGTITLLVTRLITMKNPFDYLGLKKIKKEDLRWFLIAFSGLCAGILFIELSGIKPTVLITAETFSKKTLLFLGLVLFAPFLEELLFRGFLLTRMSDLLSEKTQWIAIMITAVMFAGFHLQYDILAMIYIVAVGVFLAYMKLKTDNLWFPIFFHILGNFYAALPILF